MEFAFAPVTRDGHFFPDDLFDYIERGDLKRCPVIIGTNADEGSFWLPYNLNQYLRFDPGLSRQQANPITLQDYLAGVNLTFQGYYNSSIFQNAIAFHYSDGMRLAVDGGRRPSTGFRDAISQIFSDYFFTCDVRWFADSLASAGLPVYLYFFTQRSSANSWPQWMGVMHGYEIEVCG